MAIDPSLIVLLASLVVATSGVSARVARLLIYPAVPDPSPARASARGGVLYAFTAGMLPWKKESARMHLLAYARGVLFHVGILTGIILVVVSLFGEDISVAFGPTLALGSMAGIVAVAGRLLDRNLRAVSRADDYVSPALVTLSLLAGLGFVVGFSSRTVFWGIASALCLYLPWSKVPHSIYFFFSRVAFGVLFGRRGVLPGARTGLRQE